MNNSKSVGAISLDLVLKGGSFKRELRSMQTQTAKTTAGMKNQFAGVGKAIAAAFSVKLVASFAKSCLDLGSNLAEVQNVVDVTFKKMSGNLNEWSKKAAEQYGLSETMAKKYAGLYGSMAEAFGFAEEQAYDMATTLTGLAGDVASFYNIDQDTAYTKLKAVFSGETEALKDLGIVMTQSALDNFALSQGIGKTVNQMTEAEKVTLRYKFILDQLKNASGDFSRTQDSWANQTRILQLRIDSLKASIGEGLITALTPALKLVNTFIGRLEVMASAFSDVMGQIFGTSDKTSSAISATVSAEQELTESASESSAAVDDVTDGINNSAKAAKNSVASFDKLNILSKSDDSAAASSSSGTTATSKLPSTESLTSKMKSAGNKLVKSWDAQNSKLVESFKRTIGKIKDSISEVKKSWQNVWNNGSGKRTLQNIKKLITNIVGAVGDIAEAFTGAWTKAGRGDALIQSYVDKFNGLIELIDTIAEDFREVWNDGTGERIWSNILTTVTNINKYIAGWRQKLKQAWDKNDTGKKIWEDILGIVEDVTEFFSDLSEIRLEWLEDLDLSPIMTAVESLTSGFRKLSKAIGEKFKEVYKNVLLPFAKWTIEKALPKLIEVLAKAFEFLAKVIKRIPTSALVAIATAIVSFKVAKGVSSIVTNFFQSLSNGMSLMKAHPYAVIIAGIAMAIVGLVAAIKEANRNHLENIGFTGAIEEMDAYLDQIDECKQNIEGMCDSVNGSLTDTAVELGVVDEYKKRLDELLSKATLTPEEQAELTTIGDYFCDKYPDFKDAWDNYIQIDDQGKVHLNGNIDEIKTSLDGLIDKYRETAANAALQNLANQNMEASVSARIEVKTSAVELEKATRLMNNWRDEWNLTADNMAEVLNGPDWYTWQNKDSTKNATYGDLKKEYQELGGKLASARDEYDSLCESAAVLERNNDDLARMQAVVNGNFDDAAAVMMAYNSGLITTEQVEASRYKSIENLQKEAAKTGENTIFGLTDGVGAYAADIARSGLKTAQTYLSGVDTGLDSHSPSREMYKRAKWAIQGFSNGIYAFTSKLASPIQGIINTVKEKLAPVVSVFSGIFGGVWNMVRPILNGLMENMESFINGFVSAVNALASGVDVVIGGIGDLFGKQWSVGRLGQVYLPRFAKGAIVKAPTLAVVGDNPGASSGNPEVVAPLNKLQSMIGNTSNGEELAMLTNIYNMLTRLYEMLFVFIKQGGSVYEFIANLNGNTLFREMVRQNDLYKKRHNGRSAFA